MRVDTGAEDTYLQLASLDEAKEFSGWLTAAESAQAARMVNEALRTRYIVSRALRRRVLAECTARDAGNLEFAEDGTTKPRLHGIDGWDFNLSHAGNFVAVAARRGPVGVDLEQHREVRERALIVRRYFHADEGTAWRSLPKARQGDAFFVLWAAREAAMKCAGLGLAKGISVTRVDPAILEGREASARSGSMSLVVKILDSPEGYTLALAVGQQ